jgi:hypothetical protein
MTQPTTRRGFLDQMGRGMLATGLGVTFAGELFGRSFAGIGEEGAIDIGRHQALTDLLTEINLAELQPRLVKMWRAGEVTPESLIAAGSLANARAFGGQDYVGYHVLMALVPAYEISRELPAREQPLPILKVLYRNTAQLRKTGLYRGQRLQPVVAAQEDASSAALRKAIHRRDLSRAEALFARAAERGSNAAHEFLQPIVHDDVEVHRVVLAHRSFELTEMFGPEFAHPFLRQVVRFSVDAEKQRMKQGRPAPEIRAQLPRALATLGDAPRGNRDPGDAWVESFSVRMYTIPLEESTEAVAQALADGIDPEAVGQALSLTCNLRTLCDGHRRVHGATAGVHGLDSINAWRAIARQMPWYLSAPSLIAAGFHAAKHGKLSDRYPLPDHLAAVTERAPDRLLAITEEAIRANEQGIACAAVHHSLAAGHPAEPIFVLLRRYAISEDGRLHGEKYFRTVREEWSAARPAHRPPYLVGLARVTASAYGYDVEDRHGYRAPGYEEARELLALG